ncbi:hypothetical protein ASPCAL04621 [Aspergillus calidoustus]|uniref:Uncharacterized protein n=1 Tax=Aspergillus calidoustus TaxID=454130 RepID=A0A0U5FVG4_ASPCI|nr:hypothetical protein ASPCAL04621 [Aspergillus calidoustus]
MSSSVLATIELGQLETGTGKPVVNIAWIAGDNPCRDQDKYTPISAAGQNPCGVHFTLENGFTYYETNCGSSAIDLYYADGAFNSHCQRKNWLCTNQNQYNIRQTWTCY